MVEYAMILGTSLKSIFSGGDASALQQGGMIFGGAISVLFLLYKLMDRR